MHAKNKLHHPTVIVWGSYEMQKHFEMKLGRYILKKRKQKVFIKIAAKDLQSLTLKIARGEKWKIKFFMNNLFHTADNFKNFFDYKSLVSAFGSLFQLKLNSCVRACQQMKDLKLWRQKPLSEHEIAFFRLIIPGLCLSKNT